MIAVRDLQIGDFINTENNGVVQITVLSWKGVGYEGGASTPEHCSYIPLTEDILVKNGFEKCYNDEAPVEECYFFRLFNKQCGWLDIDAFGLEEELGAEFTYHDVNINYVHQLQHLLRLCGIEKELTI